MPSVVIIQEDIGVGSILEASFREEGYIAGVCGLAEQCERMVAERQPDLIVVASVSRATNLRQSFTKMRAYVGRRQLAIIVLGGETLPKPLSMPALTIICRGPSPSKNSSPEVTRSSSVHARQRQGY